MKLDNSLAAYRKGARTSAYLGMFLYLLLLMVPSAELFLDEGLDTQLIQRILLLAILVVVPLGFSLVPHDETDDSFVYRLSLILQPLGAALVLLSSVFGKGIPSALLAAPWLIVTGVAALFGLLRLVRMKLRSAEETAVNAGLLFLPVGAAWLLMSRLGIKPLGFGDTIVLLTAVHFHFAGFAAPLLTGLAGRRLPTTRGVQKLLVLAVACVIAGTPLVAAGITLSPVLALLGATVVSIGLVALAVLVIGWIVPTVSSRLPQILLVLSSLASLPAMVLACAYAYSIVFHKLIIDIPQMAKTHGIANAFGFVLCGLTAWALIERTEEKPTQSTSS